MIALVIRNLKIFFRDRAAVFFSLLTVFIIIGLYALFLGDTVASGMEGEGLSALIGSWIVSGLLAVISMTSTLGALGAMVDDRAKKISKDFVVSPIGRGAISGGYILSAFAIGVIMSLVTLLLGEIYIYASGGELLTFVQLLKVLGGIVLAVFSSSAIVLLVVSFVKSQNAYTALSITVGTLIGFLTGVYIPMGVLHESVQTVIKCFPVTYPAVYFRNIFMERPMEITFDGAPAEVVKAFEKEMGINFEIAGIETSLALCAIVMLCVGIIFYLLAVLNMSRKKKSY